MGGKITRRRDFLWCGGLVGGLVLFSHFVGGIGSCSSVVLGSLVLFCP